MWQVMNDIPFGDHFSVDMRWDVTPHASTSSQVELRINIPFSRKTMFRGKIENTTASETSACFAAWMTKAKQHLEDGGLRPACTTTAKRKKKGGRKGGGRKSALGPGTDAVPEETPSGAGGPATAAATPYAPSVPLRRRSGGLLAGLRGLITGFITQKPKALAVISLVAVNLYMLSSRGRQDTPEALLQVRATSHAPPPTIAAWLHMHLRSAR